MSDFRVLTDDEIINDYGVAIARLSGSPASSGNVAKVERYVALLKARIEAVEHERDAAWKQHDERADEVDALRNGAVASKAKQG